MSDIRILCTPVEYAVELIACNEDNAQRALDTFNAGCNEPDCSLYRLPQEWKCAVADILLAAGAV